MVTISDRMNEPTEEWDNGTAKKYNAFPTLSGGGGWHNKNWLSSSSSSSSSKVRLIIPQLQQPVHVMCFLPLV